MEEWKEYKLGEVCDLIPGFAFKSSDFGDYGTKVIKIKDIQPPFVDVNGADGVCIKNYDVLKLSKFLVQKGDFILAMTGATIGKIGRYIDNIPSYLNQRVLKFAPKEFVDFNFIYYYLSNALFQLYVINHIDSESAQPNISAKTIGNYPISLPSLKTQKSISCILQSLDDKIEVNRRINDNLEQQAQALFKSWFVDFEPFKDGEFVESELGMIPKGWRILSLTHIANFLNGLAMQNFRPDGLDKGIPVLKIKELGQGRCDSSSDLCSSSIDAQYKIGDGDVIFSWSGTLLVDLWCGGLCGLNQHLFKVTSKDYPKWFYYLWTKEHLKNFIHIAKDKAVTMGHIKRSHLEEAKVLLPPMNVLDCMTNMMHPILEETIVRKIESRRLSSLRDTLLPRLMSGELKINDISL